MNTNMNLFPRKNHKKIRMILIAVMVLCVILSGVFGYMIYLTIQSRPLVEYPRYTLSTTEWTSGNVSITVSNDENNISAYSFDGGTNYQESNIYESPSNGEFSIIVKDINGRESKMVPISIRNIDKESPIITFEASTTIQVGTNFSVRMGVNAYDEGAGLSSNFVAVPDTIDTSVGGEYTITYTAFDKVGNYTEKTRKVIVSSVTGTTYYRYRTLSVENYSCDPYLCNCVVSEYAQLNSSCPSGYTFNEPDQCCQTCYKTCQRTNYSEWSEWSTNRVVPTTTMEVETKVE